MTDEFLDFEDHEATPKFKDKYKAEKDEKHRIALIWPKESGGPFVKGNTHYADKYFFCKEGVCCEKLGAANTRLACLIVKYKTKKDGSIIKREGESVPFDFEILEWVFSETKYAQLKDLHNEWDLKGHDILVSLKGDPQYQNLVLTPCKEALWKIKPEFQEAIYKESEVIRLNLKRALGQELSMDEIREQLGLDVATPGEVISSEDELNSILDEV